jgi:hypothetical protein
MRKIIILAATSILLTGGAMAGANPDSNGVNKNCFGQGRSDYASDPANRGTVGGIISDRAHTDASTDDYPNQNVQLNKEYKDRCQAGLPA